MLGISKRKCTMDTPVHINGNEKKTEYRNSYIAYLNIQNVILMCCLLVYKTEKGSDKVMSSLFDFCAGY